MKTAVITLDIINEICHPDGRLARYADRIQKINLIDNINKITDWARQAKYLVCHVRVGFMDDYPEQARHSPIFSQVKRNQVLRLSQWGGAFFDQLERSYQDIEIVKNRVSPFYGTNLELILRSNQIERLVICGVATNNAVELCAREAHDRDFKVYVLQDAVQSETFKEQEASLNFMSKIGIVCSTQALLDGMC